MESALDVLSRAATMVQDNSNENRLTSKELPTTAWRRERRLRTSEYHHPLLTSSAGSGRASPTCSSPPPTAHVQHSSFSSGSVCNTNTNIPSNTHHISIMMAAAASMHPIGESINHPPSPSPPPSCDLADQVHFGQISHSQSSQQINTVEIDDVPLDMSVGNLKQRNSPPPPYREPLPGSQFTSSLARPSVITQAPPKRDVRDSTLVANRENDNRSSESIDEHFRRSLGNDYFSLFSKRSTIHSTKTPSPQPHNPQPPTAHVRNSSPTSPLTCRVATLPLQSALIQLELPPPAYPVSLPSGHHQQNSQPAHQNQALVTSKANNIMSPVVLAAQMQIVSANSPPLPLVVRPNVLQNHPQSLNLHKSSSLIAANPLSSPQSPAASADVKIGNITQTQIFNASGSSASSPLPPQQQSLAMSVTLSHLATLENSPSSSPRDTPPVSNVPPLKPSSNLPILIRVKAEPGLQHKANNSTPPESPTSAINQVMYSNSTSNSSNVSSPPSPKTTNWKSATTIPSNATTEVLASVDDHFAKALGDTWKKLQESKEIRK